MRRPAGFDRGIARTSLFEANVIGFSTRRSLKRSCVNCGLADANTSAGAPWRIWNASWFEPPKL